MSLGCVWSVVAIMAWMCVPAACNNAPHMYRAARAVLQHKPLPIQYHRKRVASPSIRKAKPPSENRAPKQRSTLPVIALRSRQTSPCEWRPSPSFGLWSPLAGVSLRRTAMQAVGHWSPCSGPLPAKRNTSVKNSGTTRCEAAPPSTQAKSLCGLC